MRLECGVLLDNSVIIHYCLFPTNAKSPTYNFFNYLEGHLELGLVTRETKKSTERTLKRVVRKFSKTKSFKAIETFYRVETFLKTETVSHSESEENLREVEELFRNIFKIRGEHLIRPWTVPSRFVNLAREMYLGQAAKESHREILQKKIFYKPIEREDIMTITAAVTLKEKYNNMFLASLDAHIIDDLISSSIKDELGVTCGLPNDILPQIKEYEDLFKRKLIS